MSLVELDILNHGGPWKRIPWITVGGLLKRIPWITVESDPGVMFTIVKSIYLILTKQKGSEDEFWKLTSI